MHIQIPTNVIRNEDMYINNDEFLLYVRLSYLYFVNNQNEEIKLNHKKLMGKLNIGDSRTFKSRLNKLHKVNLIRNKIDKLPRKDELIILFNSDILSQSKHFTMMNVSIFDYMDKISPHAYRLLFYYKSHINKDDKERKIDYCFVGVETLKNKLKMGGHTIKLANDELVENELIKIVKHKLTTNYEYNIADELIFDRYNNHYYVTEKMFKR